MNRIIRLTTLTFASILALMPLASAQQAQTTTAQTTTLPALTAQNAPQRPTTPGQQQPGGARPGLSATFTLVRKVEALNELGRKPGTALSGEQARQLSALLTPLKTAKTLTTARATDLSASIDRLLTPVQRTALAQSGGRMGGRMRGQGQGGQPGDQQGQMSGGRQGQPNGQMPQGGQDQPAPGQAAQNPSAQGAPGRPMQGDRAGMAPGSNPFLNGRGNHILSHLLDQLQK